MRNSLSLKLAAGVLGVGLAATPALSQIKVSDALSLSGFIDMSAGGSLPDAGASSFYAGFDQFELDFTYTFSDKLSAQVDLNSVGGGVMDLEQAFLTYAASDKLSLYAGKFLSSTGFESAEPTGLYQYSYSKNCGGVSGCLYGGYQNGVAASYAVNDMISLYGAFVGSVWNGTDTDIKEPGFEAQIALTPAEGVTAKIAYAFEDVGAFNTSLVNAWAMYEGGPLTIAGEVNYVTNWTAEDDNGIGFLAMVNYGLTDKLGITVRYSQLDTDVLGLENEIAVSPGYAISDAWFVLAEAQYELEAKSLNFAVESLISF